MAIAELPPLACFGVGSAAAPGWLWLFRERMAEGGLGPADIEEAFEDATRTAVQDQVEAGLDAVSDGELRRSRFVFEMYGRLRGLRRLPAARRLGPPGYDRAPAFVAEARIAAPDGLGVVAEFRRLRQLCPGLPAKVALPGPLTFAGSIAPGDVYGVGEQAERLLLDDLTQIVAQEVRALAAAGCGFVQLDEPGFANPPFEMAPEETVHYVNGALEGWREVAAVHVCFGNNASRPYVRRDFGRLMPAMAGFECSVLMLEFANREMADVEMLGELAPLYRIGAGIVDVKSFHEETPEEVADRLRLLLRYMPAERLLATADCGFSAIPRWLARSKLQALGAGTRLVRRELGLA